MSRWHYVHIYIERFLPGYVYNLIAVVFEEIVPNPQPYLEELQKIPIPDDLSSLYYHPPLTEAVAAYTSRFRQGQP